MTKRVIAITFIGGRVGSSLTMGLLDKSGVDVGAINGNKSIMNPKGFFEVTDLMLYYRKIFPTLDVFMPSFDNDYKSICEKNKGEFQELLAKCYTGDVIAVKVPYPILLPLFDGMEVTRIFLDRDIYSQANSLQECNQHGGNFKAWVEKWKDATQHMTYNDTIHFENWFDAPYLTYLDLCKAAAIEPVLNEKEVTDWIDNSLKRF